MHQLLLVCLAWHTDKAGGGVLVSVVVLVRPDPVCVNLRARVSATVYTYHISRQESAKALEAKKLLEAKEAEVFWLLPASLGLERYQFVATEGLGVSFCRRSFQW